MTYDRACDDMGQLWTDDVRAKNRVKTVGILLSVNSRYMRF